RRPHTPHTLKLRFPRLSIPARTNPEACVLVRVATTAPFDVASIEIRLRGVRGSFAVQAFLVHLYTGERLGEFGAERGRVVPSRGCLDLGPSDRDRRQLVASGTLTRSRSAFPPGVALRLSPVPDAPGGPPAGLGFTLDGEWATARRAPGARRPSSCCAAHVRRPSPPSRPRSQTARPRPACWSRPGRSRRPRRWRRASRPRGARAGRADRIPARVSSW